MFLLAHGKDIPERTGTGGAAVSKPKEKGDRMAAFLFVR
jgi:hypothetical protein